MTTVLSDAQFGQAPFYYRTRAAMTFCAPMITNALLMPYFPVWLQSLHLADWQIGLITGVPLIVRVIVAPVVAALSDRIGSGQPSSSGRDSPRSSPVAPCSIRWRSGRFC